MARSFVSRASERISPSLRPSGSAHDRINVGETERLVSLAAGGWLLYDGLKQGSLPGLGLAVLGGALAARGLTGHCPVYSAIAIDSTGSHGRLAAVAAGRGFKITRAVTINRSPEALYRHWLQFENLPRFMDHLISVQCDGDRSHWVARGPAGLQIEWDADIVSNETNRLIAWRSLEGSEVSTAGSVHFMPLPHNRGTEVRVTLKYDPPGGKLGGWIAWAFGEDPDQQIREDLRRFKQILEMGETPTVQGQPAGR